MSTCSMPPLIPIGTNSPTISMSHHEYTANITDLNNESIFLENKIISITLHLNEIFNYIQTYFNYIEGHTEEIENAL